MAEIFDMAFKEYHCIYHRLVRTNNDVEGYHTRLNAKSNGDHPPFYDLIEDLRKEAKYVDISMKLVSNQAVKSHRRRKSKEVQRKICLAWEKYDNGTIDAMLLIEEVSHFMAFNAPNDEAQELRLQL